MGNHIRGGEGIGKIATKCKHTEEASTIEPVDIKTH